MRLIGPIRRPLRLAAAVGEGVLEVALNLVREVRASLEEVAVREPEARTPSPPRRPAPAESEPGLFDSTSRRNPPPSPAPPTRQVPKSPPPPPIPDTVKTLDDEPVLVAEFGEEGAAENAGAQVSVGEPWKGYDRMNVPAVKDRLAAADREVLGAVVLYESFGKKRSSVTQAAERRLKQLTPPGSS
ncbi:MAG: hypothetical protein WKF29_07620 [Thermoleophilaceae bacterium]